jgi:3-polyprenyl-4-hydroxybenzoate decarboxylase
VQARVNWRDVLVVRGGVHSDDNSGEMWGYTGKIAIDATRPHDNQPIDAPEFDAKHMAGAWRMWDNVVVAHMDGVTDISAVRQANLYHHLIWIEDDFPLDNLELIAWYVLASVDWSRDMTVSEQGYLTIVVRPNKMFVHDVI